MLKKLALPLFAAVASIITVAIGMQISTGQDLLDYINCLTLFIISQELILIYLIVCIVNCEEDDRRCVTICIRRATYAWIVTWILFILCLRFHPF